MKTIAINQPAYLPWLGYFERMGCSDIYVVLDHVQFEKNSMVNRNKIKTANGWQWLTVPVRTRGNFGRLFLTKLEIDNSTQWSKKHWNSIFQNYKKAPYFDEYAEFLESMYKKEWQFLIDLLLYQQAFFCQSLGVTKTIVRSSTLGIESAKSDLVLDICLALKADSYLSGLHGQNYLELDKFSKAGVEVSFQDYIHPVYQQMHGEFQSHLSTLDLLLNYGQDALSILMGKCQGR